MNKKSGMDSINFRLYIENLMNESARLEYIGMYQIKKIKITRLPSIRAPI